MADFPLLLFCQNCPLAQIALLHLEFSLDVFLERKHILLNFPFAKLKQVQLF